MRVFVCEFITGGGLSGQIIPASLASEGMLMRDAVVRDFSSIPDVDVVVSYDTRLPKPEYANELIAIDVNKDPWAVWEGCFAEADAVLLIAPETDGVLSRLVALVSQYNSVLLGSDEVAVNIAGSKFRTYGLLVAADIKTIPTYRWPEVPSFNEQNYVAKMDDGAGCEDSACFNNRADLDAWMHTRKLSHIVQPFQQGLAASFSMLCKQGQAWLLSCNRQKIELVSGRFVYGGSVLNDLHQYHQQFSVIASQIAMAVPGLNGYIGVDLIVDGNEIYVVEINPRLTTSYVGLKQATGVNPARLILDLAYNDDFVMPAMAHNRIEISLHE